jgi:FdhD protein
VPHPLSITRSLRFAGDASREVRRVLPEETAVALVYDGVTHAVMMTSPIDLEDFAIGFSLTEGKIARRGDIAELEIVEHDDGIEARMWLTPDAGREQNTRRRAMLGPTGCGLCGIDSLAAALPAVPVVDSGSRPLTPANVCAANASVRPAQHLNAEARALHAAGFWTPEHGLVVLREDVGRHNALDKLVGALLRLGVRASEGVVVLTSRLSVEMVQKAAAAAAPIVVAASAPTALALRTAEAAGVTVIAIARDDGFEVFTHAGRVVPDERTPLHGAA